VVRLDAKERYETLKRLVKETAQSGDPDMSAGPTYWDTWDKRTRAALSENCIGIDQTEELRKTLDATEPMLREAIRESYLKFEQPIRAEAALILKRSARALLSSLEAEAVELEKLIASLKGGES
jgi:hypothetical protein